jgi:hypothetical protein
MEIERRLTPNTSCSGTADPISNITGRLASSPSDWASDDVARSERHGDSSKGDSVELHFVRFNSSRFRVDRSVLMPGRD